MSVTRDQTREIAVEWWYPSSVTSETLNEFRERFLARARNLIAARKIEGEVILIEEEWGLYARCFIAYVHNPAVVRKVLR